MTDPLNQWREGIQPVLARLEAFDAPSGFPLDFSARSVALLEAFRREHPNPSLTESATAYIGEALMRTGGGRWEWSGDRPVVRLDDALGLDPIDPAGPPRLTEVQRAVEEYRADHPGWQPAKEPTPGLGEGGTSEPLPWLTDWLAVREDAFPRWAADTRVDLATWDFSPGSLDALETLLRGRLHTEEDFADPRHHDFVQGAVWYYGEVLRRARQAVRWRYHRSEPGSADRRLSSVHNPWVGRPFIEQDLPDGNSTVPVFDLESAVLDGEPGYLTGRLNRLA